MRKGRIGSGSGLKHQKTKPKGLVFCLGKLKISKSVLSSNFIHCTNATGANFYFFSVNNFALDIYFKFSFGSNIRMRTIISRYCLFPAFVTLSHSIELLIDIL
jgi:hypothetical protein